MKRVLRISVYLVCGVTLLLALLHLEENWRGKRAWEAWKAERIAKGDRYDWLNLAPPEVPDADNFAKEPLVEAAITGHGSLLKDFKWPDPMPKFADWRLGQHEDLDAWAAGYKTKDLETSFAPWESQLDELVGASRRTACRFPIRYTYPEMSQDAIPAVFTFRAVARALRLRALARLHAGKADEALEDTLAILHVARHLQREPSFMVSQMQMALTGIAMQPVWEGVADHRWNDAQLSALGQALQGINLIVSQRRAVESDRVYTALTFQAGLDTGSWAQAKMNSPNLSDFDESFHVRPHPVRTMVHWLLVPKGWTYQNMLNADRFDVEIWFPVLDPDMHRVDAMSLKDALNRLSSIKPGPYHLAGNIAFPAMVNQSERMAYRQNALDEAIVACALERYRLAHRGYPGSMTVLAPAYLAKIPCDITTGAPLHYRRNADGSFDLYSVGWDGKDDGGKVVTDKEGRADDSEGDWTWPHPAAY
ncbi:MAG TPA: hypothetical protein VFF76_06245 [Holophagaceae bacterium]|jgi:hypothetical protein|nr:hypothetical protein [Holophagaceae bacterium]